MDIWDTDQWPYWFVINVMLCKQKWCNFCTAGWYCCLHGYSELWVSAGWVKDTSVSSKTTWPLIRVPSAQMLLLLLLKFKRCSSDQEHFVVWKLKYFTLLCDMWIMKNSIVCSVITVRCVSETQSCVDLHPAWLLEIRCQWNFTFITNKKTCLVKTFYASVKEKEREGVCVCVNEWERVCVWFCVCVCVCELESV